MQKNRIFRLRFKMYLMILPLVVLVVSVSSVLSALGAQAIVTKLANRHLAYKAEQLRDFAYNERNILETLNLADSAEYRTLEENSFRSYALSLLRETNEQIFIFNPEGVELERIGYSPAAKNPQLRPTVIEPGWFSAVLAGNERIGVAFVFEPFGWTVAVTDLRSNFFSGVDAIYRIHLWILLASILLMTVLITLYVGHIVRPVEELTRTIERITSENDLSRRADVVYTDEIGILATRFNRMISSLQENQRELEAEREKTMRHELETLHLLGRVSDFRDENTGGHLQRIGALSGHLSALIGLGSERQNLIQNSSRLHDIGKIAIEDQILLKPGKLTPEEFDIIKTHTRLGYDLLNDSSSEYLTEGAKIARTHHERWNGTGYPDGLAGEAIPLSGRIVSLVDVFDALLSKRPYKDPWPPEKVRALILEERGRQFDPALVDVFTEHFDEFIALLE